MRNFHRSAAASVFLFLLLAAAGQSAPPPGYTGRPYQDAYIQTGPPSIPGIVQCALFDLGGEGVGYHDSDAINHGSGELNQQPDHQRAHASPYLWNFRTNEGVDLSYVKDWADLNHTNLVNPPINQLYIGWETNGEWCNYTVDVRTPGTYRIRALYSYKTNTVTFDLNGKPAAVCHVPVETASWHYWNEADIGRITFPEAGRQLLTFHYTWGNNFAWFDFIPEAEPARP
ncbi:MAG: carbohydrate-binding protein [Verrucomicrobiota bacterium]